MYNYSNNGITVASFIDNRRATINGTFPIKIRVTFKRARKYYSTGKELSLDDWDRLPSTKSRSLIEIRTDIQNSFDKVKEIVQELEFEGEFSFEALNTRLSRGDVTTLNSLIENKIERLRENDQIGTAMYYQNALQSVSQFKGDKILITSITVEWLKSYENYMLGLGRSYSTIGMYCRAIRTMMNEARAVGALKDNQYPFGKGKYEIPASESRKLALTLQQIKEVVNYSDGSEATEKYRDLWVFSYLCNGINFTDMLQLKYGDIQNGEIRFVRAKTRRTSRVKKELCAIVTPKMQSIINRWGSPDKSSGSFIFPYLTGEETLEQEKNRVKDIVRRCNRRMKVIGEALDISGITTYTARHSYATVLKRSGANIAYISESLGHNDLKTTENYLASFEREEREKNAKLLTDFAGL